MRKEKIYDVIIIGAGIAGISAADYLRNFDLNVLILDKGRAAGGRLASKRLNFETGKVTFDYGCRYLTKSSLEFNSRLQSLMANGDIAEWNVSNQNRVLDEIEIQEKFKGKDSIRSIAIKMSENLNIRNATKVVRIKRAENVWELYSENGEIFSSLIVICTMPVPQITKLFDSSNLNIQEDLRFELEKVEYSRNIVGLFVIDGKSNLTGEGGIRFLNDDISFITDNNLKGVNSLKTALTIEMSDEFSRKYWDIPVQKTASKIIEVSGEYIGADILDYHIHKWRYSIPRKSYPKKFEYINDPGPIYLAGDAFMGNSAESAFLSGLHAAESLILTNEIKVKPAEI